MESGQASWFRIGHTTHLDDRTGCTVIIFDRLVPTWVDVRGGAPGTRETSLLDSGMLVGQVDAIVLTGGSAFGLASADGVMRFLAEHGRGISTRAGTVPIVPAAVLYDLAVGTSRFPDADDGYAAAASARVAPDQSGRVGAGAGATVAKLGGEPGGDGGLGVASVRAGSTEVTAILALNAVGDIVDPRTGDSIVRTRDPNGTGRDGRTLLLDAAASATPGENTTIGAVLVSGGVDRRALARACIAAHDALARCVVPAHTIFDGDTFFAAGERAGEINARQTMAICAAAELAVEHAVVGLFAGTRSAGGDTDNVAQTD